MWCQYYFYMFQIPKGLHVNFKQQCNIRLRRYRFQIPKGLHVNKTYQQEKLLITCVSNPKGTTCKLVGVLSSLPYLWVSNPKGTTCKSFCRGRSGEYYGAFQIPKGLHVNSTIMPKLRENYHKKSKIFQLKVTKNSRY